MAHYQDLIRKLAPAANPRHVEAWMRTQFGALDDLPADRFRHEVERALTHIAKSTPERLDELARSYGL